MNLKNSVKSIVLLITVITLLLVGCKLNDMDDLDNDKIITDNKEPNDLEDTTVEKDKDTSKDKDEKEDTTDDKNEDDKDKLLAPDFTLSNGKGDNYTLSDYRGKLVFVNFFTTWCGYCEEEMPDFQKVHENYKDEDVAIIAINVQQDEEISVEEVITWVEERNLTFPVLFDEDGTSTDHYYINGYPTTYVVDKEGYIIGYVNALNEKMLEKLINDYR
jgi:cytochrome c-type biogenesis protein